MAYRNPQEKYQANYQSAKALVLTFPEKAIELIASTCEFNEINSCITIASLSSDKNPIMNARHGINNTLDSRFPSTSSTSSRHSGSSKSPASTSSTTQSSTRPDYINIPIRGRECKLAMRTVSTENSIIRQDIVVSRLSGDDNVLVEPTQDGPVHTPYQNRILTSDYQIELTWRRDGSYKTHVAVFYLVTDDIDSDVLLGDADLGGSFNTSAYLDFSF
jgi:hypothetical protein